MKWGISSVFCSVISTRISLSFLWSSGQQAMERIQWRGVANLLPVSVFGQAVYRNLNGNVGSNTRG